MAKKKKKAKISQEPSPGKRAKIDERPGQILDSHIAWHFNRMDADGPWPSEPRHLSEYRDKLYSYEQQTVGEIFHESKAYNHSIAVGRLIHKAQARLDELRISVEVLHRLRFKGKTRLWGLLSGNIFQILWLDPKHEICPSQKRHT